MLNKIIINFHIIKHTFLKFKLNTFFCIYRWLQDCGRPTFSETLALQPAQLQVPTSYPDLTTINIIHSNESADDGFMERLSEVCPVLLVGALATGMGDGVTLRVLKNIRFRFYSNRLSA